MCLLICLHNHTAFSWRDLVCFLVEKTMLIARWNFSIEKKVCWKVQFSVPCKLMMLQLGSLFKRWLMYFINYLFTYAKSVSTTMLFLLMPYCCTLFEISCIEYVDQFGLNSKSQLAEQFEICTPVKPSNQ